MRPRHKPGCTALFILLLRAVPASACKPAPDGGLSWPVGGFGFRLSPSSDGFRLRFAFGWLFSGGALPAAATARSALLRLCRFIPICCCTRPKDLMKKSRLSLFALPLWPLLRAPAAGARPRVSFQAPQQVTWGEGAFRMPAKLLYTTDLDGRDKADLAAWMQRAADGFFPASFAEASDGDMPALELLRTGDGAPESYRLDVSRTKIMLTAPDAAGLFYGLQSLAQLAVHHGRRIPAVTIVDAPRFGYRGFMLDVSRHFRDKEFVERQLDLMARYKAQPFPLAPDRRSRMAHRNQKYPALTDIAAWRPYPDWEGGTSAANATATVTTRRPPGLLHAGRHPRSGRIRPCPAYRGDSRDRDAGAQRGGAGRLPRTLVQRQTLHGLRFLHRQRADVRIPRERALRGDRALPFGIYPYRRRRGFETGLAHLP